MATLTSIRNKLENKIFSKFGSTATHLPFSSQTVDKWGDSTPTFGTSASITIVPYNYIVSRLNFQPFGNLQENEVAMILKYDQAISANDRITYDSVTYRVVEVENYVYNDGVLAKAIRLAKIL